MGRVVLEDELVGFSQRGELSFFAHEADPFFADEVRDEEPKVAGPLEPPDELSDEPPDEPPGGVLFTSENACRKRPRFGASSSGSDNG